MNETRVANGKAVKFRSLAETRVTKTLNRIRQIGNLSVRSTYEYRPEEVGQIFKALRDEVDAAEERFTKASKNGQRSFTFE